MSPLLIASRNPGKLREFERLLAAHGWRTAVLSEAGFTGELEEQGSTYAENALAKAAAVTRATGRPALGDDSGIEVVRLKGWPGPHSARWLGPTATDGERLSGLLDEVARRTPEDRRVRYVAALALTQPRREPVVVHGTCEGVLVDPRGSHGFGYDPSFFSPDLNQTFGEAPEVDKDLVSHRSRAFAELLRTGALETAGMALTGPE